MNQLVSIIRSVRNIRAEVDTPMSKEIPILIQTSDDHVKQQLEENRIYLDRFCNPSELTIDTTIDIPEKAMSAVVTGAEIYLPLEGLIDIDKELARLQEEIDKLNKEVERVDKKLANEGFVSKAPSQVVEAEKEKQKDYINKREKVQARMDELKK
ncbi:valyl-tRNA synthetase [Gracilibacillus boraciitolerans JCM 21714]|uniref:Valine--tRNA ligase n=1 Tax=Gracilibacillus boraciitolerans JCM 21714 TaxID=1298598 RepID=W4VHF7_9BACI|nr:valyl-tRNA synthetase [Gracilibacillus boraciitolerans JCM 21714]